MVRSRCGGWRGMCLGVVLTGLAAPAAAGPDWVERGDAGSFEPGAQAPEGTKGASLDSITGSLSVGVGGADQVDMYYIWIEDPQAFTAVVASAPYDTHLWLFRLGSLGLLSNDDADDGVPLSRLTAFSTDGSEAFVEAPGDYLLTISGAGRDAHSAGGPIFSFANRTEISGPDGNGALEPLSVWAPIGPEVAGEYVIRLTGAQFPRVPSPGAGALLAALALRPRRRGGRAGR